MMSDEVLFSGENQLFKDCYKQYQGAIDQVLQCVTNGLDSRYTSLSIDTRSWLLVLAGSMVFFMQLGFAMLCAGCVRKKNVSNTLLKNLLDACTAAIAFFAVGFALAYGGENPESGSTFVGNQYFFLAGLPSDQFAFFFYQYTFSASAVTIIAGTLAERCRMASYLCYSFFMTAFVYPVIAHSIWSANGFLSAFARDPFLGSGALDFAGSGVVHMTGGTTALIATIVLGSRKGRFYDSTGQLLPVPKEFPGHSISLQMMGTLALWFGWYGFNGGSALLLSNASSPGEVGGAVVVTTTIAGASGAITALLAFMWSHHRQTGEVIFDLSSSMNGALAGLVGITAGCGFVEPWAGVIVGGVAGIIYLLSSDLLLRFKVDDAVNGIPVHFFCGMWGVLAVGFLASPGRLQAAMGNSNHVGFFYSFESGGADATLLLCQFLAVLFIIGWTSCLMYPFFVLMNALGWLRVNMVEEIAGLDASYKHATQEDHEELKEKILEEYRALKESSGEAGTRTSADQHSRTRSRHSRSAGHSNMEMDDATDTND